jgi:hypothetical protein
MMLLGASLHARLPACLQGYSGFPLRREGAMMAAFSKELIMAALKLNVWGRGQRSVGPVVCRLGGWADMRSRANSRLRRPYCPYSIGRDSLSAQGYTTNQPIPQTKHNLSKGLRPYFAQVSCRPLLPSSS